MNLELTDQKRYELELDNIQNIVLAANRLGTNITEADLALSLNIDQQTTDKLILKLQTENILK